ncbi:hypothetical protein DCC81_25170 [Chitinophaga parva]|uniref:Uncharacterized protein n=1 Tax=Chitinophaga parva TaxID=2169414 RepID=A0A2T7BB78_9BACT|nr:hypothetical protein [Chitinophaga parva]PUZ21302.1 hypothetical protein DCC81_25170 [Chitinophaga parva]
MEEKKWPYTLRVDFLNPAAGPSGIWVHCDQVQDAFRRLLMVDSLLFAGSYRVGSFEECTVAKAKIVANARAETIAELSYDSYQKQTIPGVYLTFPQTISAFEQELSSSLSSLKGYQPQVISLLVAHSMPDGLPRFRPTIGYQNLCEEASQHLQKDTRVFVSLTQKFFLTSTSTPRSFSSAPFREDFLYRDPDEALHHLLKTDFNALDENVAWENDLPYVISKAGIYKLNDGFDDDFGCVARLRSLRKGTIALPNSTLRDPGIHLEVPKLWNNVSFNYPFHRRPKTSDDNTCYLVGTYNNALSKTEKIEGLLLPYEQKTRKKSVKNKGANPLVQPKTTRPAPKKRRPRGL